MFDEAENEIKAKDSKFINYKCMHEICRSEQQFMSAGSGWDAFGVCFFFLLPFLQNPHIVAQLLAEMFMFMNGGDLFESLLVFSALISHRSMSHTHTHDKGRRKKMVSI